MRQFAARAARLPHPGVPGPLFGDEDAPGTREPTVVLT